MEWLFAHCYNKLVCGSNYRNSKTASNLSYSTALILMMQSQTGSLSLSYHSASINHVGILDSSPPFGTLPPYLDALVHSPFPYQF